MPTKNRMAMRPPALCAVPASAVGIAPAIMQPTIHFLGPKRSQRGPTRTRTRKVARSATIFPFAMSVAERLRSALRVIGVSGGNAYQERKETINPSHDRKKTLPCRQKGFYIGLVSLGN